MESGRPAPCGWGWNPSTRHLHACPTKAIRALALPVPAYAFSWDANLYAHTGYWGEVAEPYREHSEGRRPTRERAEMAHLGVPMASSTRPVTSA
jgi:hypothetical protein